MKNYKVKELLNKYGKYNINVFIESETKNFDILFKKSVVPHL